MYTTDSTGTGGLNKLPGDMGNYCGIDGTSFAAPHVSGVAALMLSVNPCLSPKGVENIIKETGIKDLPYLFNFMGWNEEVGYGLIDAESALNMAKSSHGGYKTGNQSGTIDGGCQNELYFEDVTITGNATANASSFEVTGTFEIQEGKTFVLSIE